MIYEASLYYDRINVREKPRTQQEDQWRNFDTEQAAKDFIIRRARINLENAEADMRRAKRQLAKVVRKFGAPCQHNVDDPQECGLCHDASHAAGERDK